jgi:hypothetical protein
MRKFKDPKLLLLIKELLGTYKSDSDYYFPFEGDDIFDFARERGLPIGNLTSQIFANFYLSELDHFCKEHLHLKYYIRYMDDILIFGNSIESLKKVKKKVETFLTTLRLHVHPGKNTISKTKFGVNFLGFRYMNNMIKLQNKCLVRFKKNMRNRAKLNLPVHDQLMSVNGNLGFLFGGYTKKIIDRVLGEIAFYYTQEYYFCLKGNFV